MLTYKRRRFFRCLSRNSVMSGLFLISIAAVVVWPYSGAAETFRGTTYPEGDLVQDVDVNEAIENAGQDILSVRFFPEKLSQLEENDIKSVSFTVIPTADAKIRQPWRKSEDQLVFHVVPYSKDIAVVQEQPAIFYIKWEDVLSETNFTFSVKGVFLGHTHLIWMLRGFFPASRDAAPPDQRDVEGWPKGSGDGNDNHPTVPRPGDEIYISDVYHVSVIQIPSLFKIVFTVLIAVLVSLNNINMGCHLHMDVIRNVLKTPIAPAIGFCSQFLFMPLASYAFGLLFLGNDLSWRLGLFTLGCSPGGTMSNFWTLMFDGDVDLSVTMTFVSTVAALGMMPLWMFTLGSSLLRDTEVTVPFMNMIASLLGLTIPLSIGVAIKHYRPAWAEKGRKILRPFTLFCILIGVSVGIYSNIYVFLLFNWSVVAAGTCVAWGGYIFGALFAWICRLKKAQIVAVSIETALQNPGVAFVLLILSLQQPDADISAVPLVAQLLVTGVPLWMAYLGYCSFQRFKARKDKKNDDATSNRTDDVVGLEQNGLVKLDMVSTV